MRIKSVLIAMVGLFLVVGTALAVYESWPYQTPFTIDNSDVAQTDQWVWIEGFSPDAMISNGFMVSDASDVRMADPTGTLLPVFGQDLSDTEVTWWFKVASLPVGASTYYMHTGLVGQDRDQALGLTSTDAVAVPDDYSLDITTRLTMEALGLTLDTIPTAETWVLQKSESYGLGVRNTNEMVAYITSDSASGSEEILPDGIGFGTGIVNEANCTAADHWECVDSAQAAPDDAEYVQTGVAAADLDYYEIQDTAITSYSAITLVEVYYRWSDLAVDGNNACIQPGLRLRGTDQMAAVDDCVDDGAGFRSSSQTVTRPGGGTWTAADLDDLQVILALAGNGVFARASQISVVITYQPSSEVTATVAADTEYDALATYDGANLRLYVDDVEEDITATAITINTNASTLAQGPFGGLVERTTVSYFDLSTDDSTANANDCTPTVTSNGATPYDGGGIWNGTTTTCTVADDAAIQNIGYCIPDGVC